VLIADKVSLGLVVILSIGFGAMATGVSIGLARKLGVLAHPEARSSHEIPTPRLGGFGFFIPLTIALVLVLVVPGFIYRPAWGLEPALKTLLRVALVCGSLAFVIGLMDDFLRLPPLFKLIGQIAVAGLFVYLGSQMEYTVTIRDVILESGRRVSSTKTFHFQGAGFEQIALTERHVLDGLWPDLVARMGKIGAYVPPLAVLVTILWMVGLMNAYNFMDGIDGIAGAFLIAVSIGLFAIHLPEAAAIQALRAHICFLMGLAAAFVGLSLGFLFYNWPPAKTFLGDCGSQYIGFLLAAVLAQLTRIAGEPPTNEGGIKMDIALAKRAYVDFLAVVILVWPFLYDVLYTMVRRAVRLKAIWRAHHEHLYQRLIDLGWGHRAVVLFSLPFYLVHAALFYAYCWAPDEANRWDWAILALVPMIVYTLVVLLLEARRRPATAAAVAPATVETEAEEDAGPEEGAGPAGPEERPDTGSGPGETAEGTPEEPADLETPPEQTEK
jgi:UDP-N-acetylmuramyl pentapeptide phosphotransferase/UDP-N-acetylglucosamine-1-phosphate transferase